MSNFSAVYKALMVQCLQNPNFLILKTKRLHVLRQSLAALTIQQTIQSQDNKNGSQTRDNIKLEIESILASDCLFCGEYMINSIDQPFIDDWANVNNGWD